MAAAKSGDPDVMRMLLDAGADHEARYPNGKTPLYCAAEWGRLGAVRVLLDAGARPEVAADRLMTDWSKTEADMRRGCYPLRWLRERAHDRGEDERGDGGDRQGEEAGVAVRFASCQLPRRAARGAVSNFFGRRHGGRGVNGDGDGGHRRRGAAGGKRRATCHGIHRRHRHQG